MRNAPLEEVGSGASGSMAPQAAIVLIVLVLGASFYLWRMRYLRSRAALITILAIILALLALAMSGG
jgi:hypothetical protein